MFGDGTEWLVSSHQFVAQAVVARRQVGIIELAGKGESDVLFFEQAKLNRNITKSASVRFLHLQDALRVSRREPTGLDKDGANRAVIINDRGGRVAGGFY